jgi:uncharacterized protein (DUF433 family)
MPSPTFLSAAEAAYVAGLSEPTIARAMEEHVVSAPLVRAGTPWRISRLAAAFISFYFNTEQASPQTARKTTLASNVARIIATGKLQRALALRLSSRDTAFDLVLARHISAATIRSRKLDRALRSISVSGDVMWGMPVFSGTRVLVETVVGSINEGTPLAQLKDSYAFLTEDLVESAHIYMQSHPPQRRARPLSASHPEWKITSVTFIRPQENDLAPLPRRMPIPKLGQDGE